jgi:hypothetical protein
MFEKQLHFCFEKLRKATKKSKNIPTEIRTTYVYIPYSLLESVKVTSLHTTETYSKVDLIKASSRYIK